MNYPPRVCPSCSITHFPHPAEVRRGAGIYCSVKCYRDRPPRSVSDRFWRKVLKTPDCWAWSGAKQRRGYGCMETTKGVNRSAHRVSWELHFGEIPKGMCVLHKCDNPECTRPDHLFLGTLKDNTKDMISKGRHLGSGRPKGTRLSPASLESFRRKRGITPR